MTTKMGTIRNKTTGAELHGEISGYSSQRVDSVTVEHTYWMKIDATTGERFEFNLNDWQLSLDPEPVRDGYYLEGDGVMYMIRDGEVMQADWYALASSPAVMTENATFLCDLAGNR